MEKVVFTAGSVIGSSHVKSHKNNQDSFSIYKDEDYFIGVVTDGCSSGENSEVGAKLISKFISYRLSVLVRKYDNIEEIVSVLEKDLLNFMKDIISFYGCIDNQISSISNFFLATIISVIITQEKVFIFSVGDGFYKFNNKEVIIDQDNHPNYFAYNLLIKEYKQNYNEKNVNQIPEYTGFEILENRDIRDFESLIISTDGIEILNSKASNTISILGQKQEVGDVDQFIKTEKYFKNKSLLQKRLNILGKNKVFDDDTTFIVVKKVMEVNDESDNKQSEN